MATPENEALDPKVESIWRDVLLHGHHHRLSFLPGNMRCTACNVAMKGFGGKNLCDDALPHGGAEVDIAVVFADLRGSTGLAEKLGPRSFAALLNRFYNAASQAFLPHNAMIDKMVGDEVVAIFFPNTGPRYRANAVHAAVQLLRLAGYGSGAGGWIPVGIGVNAGTAFCGRVGVGEVHDFTALGDTMNTGARLQAQAQAGEVVMSEELYLEVQPEFPGLESRTLQLRGREAAFHGRVLKL